CYSASGRCADATKHPTYPLGVALKNRPRSGGMSGLNIEQLLDGLTEPQKQAVMHVDGPLLIVAGAGSGKTRVITRRVAYLISQGIVPASILAITFTNKAAGEM